MEVEGAACRMGMGEEGCRVAAGMGTMGRICGRRSISIGIGDGSIDPEARTSGRCEEVV
jgi:hypothetical protein